MSENTPNIYDSNRTATRYFCGGFDRPSLSSVDSVNLVLSTIGKFARLLPDPSEYDSLESMLNADGFRSLVYLSGLYDYIEESNDFSVLSAFLIERLVSQKKDTIAPTYVKGTQRFEEHLAIMSRFTFKSPKTYLSNRVNLGKAVLDTGKYPDRLQIAWVSKVAHALDALTMDYSDYRDKEWSGFLSMLDMEKINHMLDMLSSDRVFLSALGLAAAQHGAGTLSDITGSKAYLSYKENLIATLKAFAEYIPFEQSELFEYIEEEEDTEDEEIDNFTPVAESSDVVSDDEDPEDELLDEDFDSSEDEDPDEEDDGSEDDVVLDDTTTDVDDFFGDADDEEDEDEEPEEDLEDLLDKDLPVFESNTLPEEVIEDDEAVSDLIGALDAADEDLAHPTNLNAWDSLEDMPTAYERLKPQVREIVDNLEARFGVMAALFEIGETYLISAQHISDLTNDYEIQLDPAFREVMCEKVRDVLTTQHNETGNFEVVVRYDMRGICVRCVDFSLDYSKAEPITLDEEPEESKPETIVEDQPKQQPSVAESGDFKVHEA